MSIALMTRAWQHAPYSGNELLLLLALCDFANDEGECFPSQVTLAVKSRMSERQVRRILKQFEADGQIAVTVEQEGRRRRNRYQLTTGQDVLPPPPTAGQIESGRPDTAMAGESPIEPSEEKPPAATPQTGWTKAERDIVWDGLVDVCGAPVTNSERGDFGKTSRELRDVIPRDAAAADILVAMRARRSRWTVRYPGAAFTHRVLRQHWADLGRSEGEVRGPAGDEAELEDDGTGRQTF